MQDKIIELETKYSYQEDLLSQLNREVIRQQRQIDELLREIKLLKEQFDELLGRDSKQVVSEYTDEKPPHY